MILEENMVAAKLVHRDFENEIRNFGDVVNTRRPGNFKIKRKDDGTTLAQRANTTNVRVPLDQWFYNSFIIKDGEASLSFQDLVDTHLLLAMRRSRCGSRRSRARPLFRGTSADCVVDLSTLSGSRTSHSIDSRRSPYRELGVQTCSHR